MASIGPHYAAMVKLNLRLPDELRDELARRAASAKRSLNSEIVYRLDLSLRFERELLEAAIEDALDIKPRRPPPPRKKQ